MKTGKRRRTKESNEKLLSLVPYQTLIRDVYLREGNSGHVLVAMERNTCNLTREVCVQIVIFLVKGIHTTNLW